MWSFGHVDRHFVYTQTEGVVSRVSIGVVMLAPWLCAACPETSPDLGPDPALQGCDWQGTGGGEAFAIDDPPSDPGFAAYFEAQVAAVDGGWLIEGDVWTADFARVRAAYRRTVDVAVDSAADGAEGEHFRGTVVCNTELEIDEIWSPSDKLALSYCFDRSWEAVPERYALARAATQQAAAAWESAADINFIELAAGPDCSHDTALFVVDYLGDACLFGGLLCPSARAFFPNEPAAGRVLSLWSRAFDNQGPGLDYTMAHELGHILGLWHEHARFEQPNGVCALSDISGGRARAATEADADSVMGYGSCASSDPVAPHPSALDRATVAQLYNLPRPLQGGALAEADGGSVVWHRPASGEFELWRPSLAADDSLSFTASSHCWLADCDNVEAWRWKPIVLRASGPIDVLMYGPGAASERLLLDVASGTPQPGALPAVLTSSVDVPVVLDRLFPGDERAVWWMRAGWVDDPLWRDLLGDPVATQLGDDAVFTDEHFSATAGRLWPVPAQSSSLLWTSPTQSLAYLSTSSGDQLVELALDTQLCGLELGVAHVSVPGDYDGDGIDELLWYDHDLGEAIFWPELGNCVSFEIMNVGAAKLAAFRVAGSRDSLLVYRPQSAEVELLAVPSAELIASHEISGDRSPLVRDFDGDGCGDLLWFAPTQSTSELWRGDCFGGFVRSSVEHPLDAYPLGYGLGHGRP